MDFKLSKQNALTKEDKSNEQRWDEKIQPLCDKINSKENFYTTSSCSGRITIVKTSTEKIPDAFLFKSHKKINLEQLKTVIQNIPQKEIFYFRQEPCAIHIACKTLEDAQSLLDKARSTGWKKSGIISSNQRYICELFSTELIATPFTRFLEDDYLTILVQEANKKLERTWEKIEKIYKEVNKL